MPIYPEYMKNSQNLKSKNKNNLIKKKTKQKNRQRLNQVLNQTGYTDEINSRKDVQHH